MKKVGLNGFENSVEKAIIDTLNSVIEHVETLEQHEKLHYASHDVCKCNPQDIAEHEAAIAELKNGNLINEAEFEKVAADELKRIIREGE